MDNTLEQVKPRILGLWQINEVIRMMMDLTNSDKSPQEIRDLANTILLASLSKVETIINNSEVQKYEGLI